MSSYTADYKKTNWKDARMLLPRLLRQHTIMSIGTGIDHSGGVRLRDGSGQRPPVHTLSLSDCMNFDVTIIFIKTPRFSIISNYKHTTV